MLLFGCCIIVRCIEHWETLAICRITKCCILALVILLNVVQASYVACAILAQALSLGIGFVSSKTHPLPRAIREVASLGVSLLFC